MMGEADLSGIVSGYFAIVGPLAGLALALLLVGWGTRV